MRNLEIDELLSSLAAQDLDHYRQERTRALARDVLSKARSRRALKLRWLEAAAVAVAGCVYLGWALLTAATTLVH